MQDQPTAPSADVPEAATPSTTAAAAPSTALVPVRSTAELIMSDDLMRRTFRLAEGLALSGAWKDIKKAEQAFAKIVVGIDLGLTPAESMQGIHIVEGGVQLHYATLARFIRARDSYDFKAFWIKRTRPVLVPVGQDGEVREGEIVGERSGQANSNAPVVTTYTVEFEDEQGGVVRVEIPEERVRLRRPVLELVALETDDPLDEREVYGAVVQTTVNGEVRGSSRFNYNDAVTANLIKPGLDRRAAWSTSRRNMYLARAMSNAVKWDVPEVMNGMPVYSTGELDGVREQRSLTAPVGGGGDEGQGLDLGPQVERIIERATELGHRGLSNRAAVETAVSRRAPGVVKAWAAEATAELDRFAAEKAAAATVDETNPGQGVAEPEERSVASPEETVSGPVESPPAAAEEPPPEADVADETPAPAPEGPEAVDDPQTRLAAALDAETSEPEDGK